MKQKQTVCLTCILLNCPLCTSKHCDVRSLMFEQTGQTTAGSVLSGVTVTSTDKHSVTGDYKMASD